MAVTAPVGPLAIRRAPVPRTTSRMDWVVPLLTASLAAAAVVMIVVAAHGTVGAVLVVAALAVVPGASMVHACRIPDRTVRAVLVVPVALAVDTVVAIVMTGTHLWFPSAVAVALLVVAGAFPLVRGVRAVGAAIRTARIARTPASPAALGTDRVDPTANAPRPALLSARTRPRRTALLDVLAGAAVLALWIVAAGRTLSAVSMGTPVSTLLPAAAGTVIARTGTTLPAVDALTRWPGLPATATFLGGAAGVAPSAAVLAVASVALVLVAAALTLGLARTLGPTWTPGTPRTAGATGVAWIAPLVTTAVAAVVPGAMLPRAFGIVLLVAAVLVAVRCLRSVGPFRPATRDGAAIVVLVVVQIALAAVDPLSALAAAVAIGPFLLSGTLRPRWVVAPLVLVPVVALVVDVVLVRGRVELGFGLGPETDPGLTQASAAIGSAALVVAVVLLLVALTAVGAVRMLRDGHRTAAGITAWLVVGPVLAAAMFGAGTLSAPDALAYAMPFLAVGSSLAFRSRRRRPFAPRPASDRRPGATRTAIAALLVGLTVAAVGSVTTAAPVPRTDASTLAVARWLDGRFRPGDTVVTTMPMPVLVGPHYGRYLARADDVVVLPHVVPDTASVYRTIAAHSGVGSTWVVFRDGHDGALRRSIASVSARRYARDGVTVYELIYRGA